MEQIMRRKESARVECGTHAGIHVPETDFCNIVIDCSKGQGGLL